MRETETIKRKISVISPESENDENSLCNPRSIRFETGRTHVNKKMIKTYSREMASTQTPDDVNDGTRNEERSR
jgi:hypothetical protein